jgi:hypothetical protein
MPEYILGTEVKGLTLKLRFPSTGLELLRDPLDSPPLSSLMMLASSPPKRYQNMDKKQSQS